MRFYLASLLLLAGIVYIEAKALPPLSLEASSSNQTGLENQTTEHILRKQHVVDDTSDQNEPQDDLETMNKELPHNFHETQYSSQDTHMHNAANEESEEDQRTNMEGNEELNDDEFLSIIDLSDSSQPQDDFETLCKELAHADHETQDTLMHNATHENSDEVVQRTNMDANEELNDDKFLSIIKRDPYFAGSWRKISEGVYTGRVKRDLKTHLTKHKTTYIAGGVVAGLLTAGTLIVLASTIILALGEATNELESSVETSTDDINSEQKLNGYYEKNATEKRNKRGGEDEWSKMVEKYGSMTPYASMAQFLKSGQTTNPKVLQVHYGNFKVTPGMTVEESHLEQHPQLKWDAKENEYYSVMLLDYQLDFASVKWFITNVHGNQIKKSDLDDDLQETSYKAPVTRGNGIKNVCVLLVYAKDKKVIKEDLNMPPNFQKTFQHTLGHLVGATFFLV